MRCGKKMVKQYLIRAQAQIDRGHVHENQGMEFEPKVRDWLAKFDKYLTYQEKCEIQQAFSDGLAHLDYGRQGINDPAKREHSALFNTR
jgi:hypothetical protein